MSYCPWNTRPDGRNKGQKITDDLDRKTGTSQRYSPLGAGWYRNWGQVTPAIGGPSAQSESDDAVVSGRGAGGSPIRSADVRGTHSLGYGTVQLNTLRANAYTFLLLARFSAPNSAIQLPQYSLQARSQGSKCNWRVGPI